MAGNDILHASTISPQVLVSQQLGTTEAAVYTVPASTSVKVAQGTLCNVTSLTAPPTLTLGAVSASGGSLAAGTYYFKVTAVSSAGETLASNEVTATTTGTTSSIPLSWTNVTGAASYRVYYGTAAGGENSLVTGVTGATSYTVTSFSGATTQYLPTVSGFGFAANVYLSVVRSGGTLGDGTHRIINGYALNANDTLALKEFIAGAMLGPGDVISGYATAPVDLVLTGTVHA
jgi:hypothetical protein